MSNPTAEPSITTQAIEKLNKEKPAAKEKSNFEIMVLDNLIKRAQESEALCQDILQAHKTWNKCKSYINDKARKLAVGNCAVVEEMTVYEWAEDYYHLDDKAQEEKKELAKQKAQEKVEKVKQEAASKPAVASVTSVKPVKQEKKKAEDGQMDIFSMFGM